jgi:hypothetical protein
MTSLSEVFGALGFPLGPHPKSDLATDLYSFYTPIAIINESGRRISFNSKKFVISLSVTIEALSSPLGTRLERVLTTDIYSVSTPDVYQDESYHRINFRRLQESYNITTIGDQSIELSSRIPSKNKSRYRSILYLCPSSRL